MFLQILCLIWTEKYGSEIRVNWVKLVTARFIRILPSAIYVSLDFCDACKLLWLQLKNKL